MQQQQYGYNMQAQHMNSAAQQIPNGQQRREESFQSQATVFILKDKTWREQSQGLVQFVFDLNTYALRLIISPGTPDEMDRRLRPRIRSKGPRAYVVRAQAPNNGDDSILAVRFEREEDSQNFRKFVEKRDVDNSQPNTHGNNRMANHSSSNAQPQSQNANVPYSQQGHPPQGYQNPNMAYPNMGNQMMYSNANKGPNQPYNDYSREQYNQYYYPSPSPHTQYSQDYRNTPSSQMVNPATTPHNVSTHPSLYSNNGPNGGYPNGTQNSSGLLHRPTGSHANNQWNQSPGYNNGANNQGGGGGHQNNPAHGPGAPNGAQPGGNGGANNQEGPQDGHGYNGNGGNNTGNVNNGNAKADHGHRNDARYRNGNSMSGNGKASGGGANQNSNEQAAPANVNILKLTETNLEQHNRVYAESSMASKRKNVRDIILEQLSWQREHGMAH